MDQRNLIEEMSAAEQSGKFTYDPEADLTKADNIDTLTEGTKSEDGTASSRDHDEERHYKIPTPQPPRPASRETATTVRDAQTPEVPVANHTATTVNGGDGYDIHQLEDELNQVDFDNQDDFHVSFRKDGFVTS